MPSWIFGTFPAPFIHLNCSHHSIIIHHVVYQSCRQVPSPQGEPCNPPRLVNVDKEKVVEYCCRRRSGRSRCTCCGSGNNLCDLHDCGFPFQFHSAPYSKGECINDGWIESSRRLCEWLCFGRIQSTNSHQSPLIQPHSISYRWTMDTLINSSIAL